MDGGTPSLGQKPPPVTVAPSHAAGKTLELLAGVRCAPLAGGSRGWLKGKGAKKEESLKQVTDVGGTRVFSDRTLLSVELQT